MFDEDLLPENRRKPKKKTPQARRKTIIKRLGEGVAERVRQIVRRGKWQSESAYGAMLENICSETFKLAPSGRNQ